jgi:hypothetical protein
MAAESKRLTTVAEYLLMAPERQGYVFYMEAEWPGSQLNSVKCPYDRRTREGKAWMRGTFKAVLEAQDSEE